MQRRPLGSHHVVTQAARAAVRTLRCRTPHPRVRQT